MPASVPAFDTAVDAHKPGGNFVARVLERLSWTVMILLRNTLLGLGHRVHRVILKPEVGAKKEHRPQHHEESAALADIYKTHQDYRDYGGDCQRQHRDYQEDDNRYIQ